MSLRSFERQFLLWIVRFGKFGSELGHVYRVRNEVGAVLAPGHPQLVSASLDYRVDWGTEAEGNGFLRPVRDFFSSSHGFTIAARDYFKNNDTPPGALWEWLSLPGGVREEDTAEGRP